ncbi:MAG: hypothetical protein K8L99_30510, partial [Anaerolineae bacterium]|nr:hypothetical protein [Anaerolineae bacterium]
TPEIYTSDFDRIALPKIELYQPHLLDYPIAWSSDSETLFFISKSRMGFPQIVSRFLNSLDEETEIIIPLSDSEELTQVYWSPDAKYLLYQTLSLSATPTETHANDIRQPETYSLYLFNLETQQSKLVTATSYRQCVAWSHDSRTFASISNLFQEKDFPFPSANLLQIYDLDLERLSELDLTTKPTSSLGCPIAWSNDGQLIAMKSVELKEEEGIPTHQTGISVVEISTGELRTLGVSDLPVYDIRSLTWSSDDSWIAIGTHYNAFSDIRLFLVATGEEFIITVDGLPLLNPTWRDIGESF